MKEECLKRMEDIDQTNVPSYTNKIFVLKFLIYQNVIWFQSALNWSWDLWEFLGTEIALEIICLFRCIILSPGSKFGCGVSHIFSKYW